MVTVIGAPTKTFQTLPSKTTLMHTMHQDGLPQSGSGRTEESFVFIGYRFSGKLAASGMAAGPLCFAERPPRASYRCAGCSLSDGRAQLLKTDPESVTSPGGIVGKSLM
jgi:hypothetical protein